MRTTSFLNCLVHETCRLLYEIREAFLNSEDKIDMSRPTRANHRNGKVEIHQSIGHYTLVKKICVSMLFTQKLYRALHVEPNLVITCIS